MAGSFTRKHLNKNFELVGVFATVTAYLKEIHKSAAEEGMIYYDTTLNQLRTHDGSSWSAAGQSSHTAGSLDSAANIGTKITLDSTIGSGIELEASDSAIAASGQLLLLDNDDVGSDVHSLEITHDGTAPVIQFTTAADATYEIAGTSTAYYITANGQVMARSLSLGDDLPIFFGGTAGTGDVTIDFCDSVALGTSGGGLLIEAIAADEQISIGSSTFAFDVYFSGESDFQNNMLWDMNGGINSVGALTFDNTDVLMGDSDAIVLGDGYDLIIQSGGGSVVLTTSTDNTTIQIGDGTKDFDLYWYAGTTAKYVLFDESGADIDLIDVDLGLDDSALLQFGSDDDVTMQFDGTNFEIFSTATADMPFVLGGTTYGFDITYHFEGTDINLTTDYDGLLIALNGADFRFEDDDYILLGDQATGGGTADGTLRWDSSGATIEVVGVTQFENNVTMDGNLTVAGTLATTGSWNPGALGLGDDEALTFGDDKDFTIDYDHTATSCLLFESLSIGNHIQFGYTNGIDVTFHGSTYNTVFDASAEGFLVQDGGTLNFGSDVDIIFTASSNNLAITAGTANDGIHFGGGNTTYLDIIIEHPSTTGAHFWWDLSGQECFVGKDNKGWDMTWYSEEASDYMKWDQNGNTNVGELIFEDATILMMDDTKINFGDSRDWAIFTSGTNLIISEGSAAGKNIQFGVSGVGIDLRAYGDTDGYDCTWDAGENVLFFSDGTELGVGGSAGTHDLMLHSDGTTGVITGTVNMSIIDDSKTITLGGSGSTLHGTDIVFNSASGGNTIKFDAGNGALTFSGISQVFDGGTVAYTFASLTGSGMSLTATDSDVAKFTFGLSGTNSMDVAFEGAQPGLGMTYVAGASAVLTLSGVALIVAGSVADAAYKIYQLDDDLLIGGATDTSVNKIIFGASSTNSTDLVWQAAADGEYVTFDGGSGNVTFTEIDLVFPGLSTVSYTLNVGTTDVLQLRATDDAEARLVIGLSGTNSMDVLFEGAQPGLGMTWDAGASAALTLDGAALVVAGSTTETSYKIYQSGNNLMIGATADTTVNKIQFGLSGTNSTDVAFDSAQDGLGMTYVAGASATLTLSGVALVVAGSTAETAYKIYQSGNTLMVGGTADTSVNKIQFGISGTNSTDVVFAGEAAGSDITWDAGLETFTSDSLCTIIDTYGDSTCLTVGGTTAAPTTTSLNGAICFSATMSKFYVYSGTLGVSAWVSISSFVV